MTCPMCTQFIQLPSSMLIHAQSLEQARWALRCACGYAFSVGDFMSAGAVLQRGRDAILGISDPN